MKKFIALIIFLSLLTSCGKKKENIKEEPKQDIVEKEDNKKEEPKKEEPKKEEPKKEEPKVPPKKEEHPKTPPKKEPPKKEIPKKDLNELGYTKENLDTLNKLVSKNSLDVLLKTQTPSNIAMSLINETYYIDEYLNKYINYRNKKPNLSPAIIIRDVNCHLDVPFYTQTEKTDTSLGKFVMLNKHYTADSSYPSSGIISVPGKYHIKNASIKLNKECYEAFLKMYQDALDAGYGFRLKSGYRSYQVQKDTYNYWVRQEKGNYRVADTYSARAGSSEHQTGYAFDIRDYNYQYEDYSKSKSFKWVSQNCYKYGFIIRFPKGKENITGYQYESWHYRYVGKEAATYIHNHNLTFEEYYEYFIRFKNPRNLK